MITTGQRIDAIKQEHAEVGYASAESETLMRDLCARGGIDYEEAWASGQAWATDFLAHLTGPLGSRSLVQALASAWLDGAVHGSIAVKEEPRD